MPAVSTIVIADGQATPVNHSFIPLGPDSKGVWWFEDQSAAYSIGYGRISISLTRPPIGSAGAKSASDRVNRVKIAIYTPTLETVSTNDAGLTPPPTVAFVDRWNCEFSLPERGVAWERKNALAYAKNLLDHAVVEEVIQDLRNLY